MTVDKSEDPQFFRGARVTNKDRIAMRALNAAMIANLPQWRRPEAGPDALALARSRPSKGWAKRWLRARGMPL